MNLMYSCIFFCLLLISWLRVPQILKLQIFLTLILQIIPIYLLNFSENISEEDILPFFFSQSKSLIIQILVKLLFSLAYLQRIIYYRLLQREYRVNMKSSGYDNKFLSLNFKK